MGVKNLKKKKILDILCVWSSSTCERIRKDLNFKKSEGIYYDSTEIDETMKYITMLPKKNGCNQKLHEKILWRINY